MDLGHQIEVLADSLRTMAVVAASREGSPARALLRPVSVRHDREHLDVFPHLYDLWLDSLVEAARRNDLDFSEELEAAWREALSIGIGIMRAAY